MRFDTKSNQITRNFSWPFSLFIDSFGLTYSPLNSATLSWSSEVTLTFLFLSFLFLFYSRSVVDMSAVEIDPSEGLVIELDFSAGEDEANGE